MAKPDLRAECIRLRQTERLSYREIAKVTGASKGSLHLWLRDCPRLTQEERRQRQKVPPAVSKQKGSESHVHRLIERNKLSGIQIAKVSEAAVMFRMLLWGLNPFGSVFDGDRTDWLVEVPSTNKVWKIQVKTTHSARWGLPYATLRHRKHSDGSTRYKKGEFDFIVGYDTFTDQAYVWSWDETKHLAAGITVCPDALERWDKLTGE